eukprot:SAG31_NODE_22305_length_528_cov_5.627040_1_plen_168_part_10
MLGTRWRYPVLFLQNCTNRGFRPGVRAPRGGCAMHALNLAVLYSGRRAAPRARAPPRPADHDHIEYILLCKTLTCTAAVDLAGVTRVRRRYVGTTCTPTVAKFSLDRRRHRGASIASSMPRPAGAAYRLSDYCNIAYQDMSLRVVTSTGPPTIHQFSVLFKFSISLIF